MFFKKNNKVVEDRLSSIEERIKRLECGHETFKFRVKHYSFRAYTSYFKECTNCGVVLKRYESKKKYLKAKARKLSKEAGALKDEARAIV